MSIVVGIIIVALISWLVAVFGMAIFHTYERYVEAHPMNSLIQIADLHQMVMAAAIDCAHGPGRFSRTQFQPHPPIYRTGIRHYGSPSFLLFAVSVCPSIVGWCRFGFLRLLPREHQQEVDVSNDLPWLDTLFRLGYPHGRWSGLRCCLDPSLGNRVRDFIGCASSCRLRRSRRLRQILRRPRCPRCHFK